ncbi:MAG: orotate phosphoribosyltransferase [Tepidisphaeraceae bacterium]
MTRQELARRIADVAVLRGSFTLRSGRTSNYYLDKYRFETDPQILRALATMFAARIGEHVTRIAGAELGAVALATATALETGKPFVIVRNQKKDYGTGRQIEGVLQPGESVVIVEDILTTGAQAIEAANALRGAGATIDRIIGVVDRLEGARQAIESAGFTYESLFTSRDLGVME